MAEEWISQLRSKSKKLLSSAIKIIWTMQTLATNSKQINPRKFIQSHAAKFELCFPRF